MNGSLAKGNVNDRMKIIEIGESMDIPVRIDTYMYPTVRERQHSYNFQARLDPEEAAKVRVEVLRREMGDELFSRYRKLTLEKVYLENREDAELRGMKCRAGKSSFTVNWQGQMRSCVVLDQPSISLEETTFAEAWEQVVRGTEKLRMALTCAKCRFRDVCDSCVAAAIAETGSADGVPEYLCKYTEAMIQALQDLKI